ncbi:hypothetical protein Actkin_02859 [Actinokineospora sp. UTMC 2448]|nr:hypothetical protein Actkin_02859 [Actinokineospora sp. UTMC 2448]
MPRPPLDVRPAGTLARRRTRSRGVAASAASAHGAEGGPKTGRTKRARLPGDHFGSTLWPSARPGGAYVGVVGAECGGLGRRGFSLLARGSSAGRGGGYVGVECGGLGGRALSLLVRGPLAGRGGGRAGVVGAECGCPHRCWVSLLSRVPSVRRVSGCSGVEVLRSEGGGPDRRFRPPIPVRGLSTPRGGGCARVGAEYAHSDRLGFSAPSRELLVGRGRGCVGVEGAAVGRLRDSGSGWRSWVGWGGGGGWVEGAGLIRGQVRFPVRTASMGGGVG